MKKLISLLMALVMVFSMAPAVFAEENDGSIVLLDETAVIVDDWGADYNLTAPGDGNITVTFDDTTGYDIEYQLLINGIDANRKYSYEDGYTYTWMVSEGDSIYFNICLMSEDRYVAGNIDFTLVYTPAEASSEQEVISGTATFEDAASAYTGKIINYTAQTNGTIVLNLYPHDNVGIEYKFEVSGGMAGWYYTYDGDPLTQNAELSRGDTVEVLISTSSAFDVYVPGTVDYELIFTPSEDGGEGEGGEIDTVLELGDNNISLANGEGESAQYIFTPEEDAVLSFTITELVATTIYDATPVDHTEFVNDYLDAGMLTLSVNGEAYVEPVAVTAGESVVVTLSQNRMLIMEGYGWDAVLNIAVGSNEGSSKVEIGEATFFIDEGQESSEIYTFTPEQDGLLYIDFIELCSSSPANGDEDCTDFAEEILGGTLFLYVNEVSYIGKPISVTAGVPVEIYISQVPMLVNKGYSWYAYISLSIGSEEAAEPTELFVGENEVILAENESVESVTCFHTATETGTLVIDVPFYMSVCEGEELYPENVFENLTVVVNGEVIYELPYSIDVNEGDEVTVEFVKNWWAGIGYAVLVNLSYALPEAEPTEIFDGENYLNIAEDERVKSLTAVYTATETGTLKFDIPQIMSVCDMEYEYVEDILDALTIKVNDVAVEAVPFTVDVTEGDVVTVEFVKNWWAGIGFQLQLNASYVLPEAEPTELWDGENFIELAEDEKVEYLNCFYTATETGTLTIDVPLYMSMCEGEEEYGSDFIGDISVYVNDMFVEALPYSVEVTEGDVVTIKFVKNWWAGIGYIAQVNLSYELEEAEPTELFDGENEIFFADDERVETLSCFYTATENGTLVINVLDCVSVCDGEYENVDDLFEALTISVNGVAVEANPASVEVSEGDVVTIEFAKNWWAGIGFEATVSLSYEEEVKVLYGDVNGDGKVNVLDANLVRKAAARLIELDENQIVAADVNGDGSVNILDANLIRKYAAKLIEIFPVEE